MELETVLIAVGFITLTYFSLRLARIKLVPRGIDADFHLLCTSKFKNGRPPKTLGRFVIGDAYVHPPFLHLLLSFFPEKWRPQVLFMLDLFADYSLALVTFFVASQLIPFSYSLIAGLIYCITPASFIQSVSESARPIGALWCGLTILFLLTQNILFMVLAAITTTLTLLSHKMATQTLLFTCLMMAPFIAGMNIFFPLPLLVGLVLAFLLTKGRYMEVLRDHAAYIAFHIRYGSWNKKKKMPGSPKQLVKLQPFFFLPLIGLWVNPGVFLFANTWILAWYAATLVLFLAWVWGDSDRYLAYSTVPTAILSAVSLNVGISMLFMIPPLLVSSAMIFRNTQVFYRLEPHPDFTKFDTSEDAVFLVMPSSLTYVSARYLKGRILVGGGNAVAVKFDLETLPNMMRTTPNKLLDDYPITHCLLGPKNLDFIKPVEDRFEFVMKTNGFVLYKRKQPHS